MPRLCQTHGDIESVARLTQLNEFDLHGTGVTRDIASVTRLTHLTSLSFLYTEVTAAEGCPELRGAYLHYDINPKRLLGWLAVSMGASQHWHRQSPMLDAR